MDSHTDKQTDILILTDNQSNKQTYGYTALTDRQSNIQTDRYNDRWTGRQTNGQIYGQADREPIK